MTAETNHKTDNTYITPQIHVRPISPQKYNYDYVKTESSSPFDTTQERHNSVVRRITNCTYDHTDITLTLNANEPIKSIPTTSSHTSSTTLQTSPHAPMTCLPTCEACGMITSIRNYYIMRYYSSELGRWINRDPMGERGFVTAISAALSFDVRHLQLEDTRKRLLPVLLQLVSDLRELRAYEILEVIESFMYSFCMYSENSWVGVSVNSDQGLYLFVNNYSINFVDILGLDGEKCSKWDQVKAALANMRDSILASGGEIARILGKLPSPRTAVTAITTPAGAVLGPAKDIVSSPESAVGLDAVKGVKDAQRAMLNEDMDEYERLKRT